MCRWTRAVRFHVGMNPRQIHDNGVSMAFVPEDRLGMGLVGSMGMTGNMMLRSWRIGRGPLVNRKAPGQLARAGEGGTGCVTPSTDFPVRRLSGGNVQRSSWDVRSPRIRPC